MPFVLLGMQICHINIHYRKAVQHMLYRSIEALCARLGELLSLGRSKAIFILLPNAKAWSKVLGMLRPRCAIAPLSQLCSDEHLPHASQICALAASLTGNVLLLPVGELIRTRSYTARAQLLDKLNRSRHKGGALVVPLLACAQEFRALLPAPTCHVLELDGEDKPCQLNFLAHDLPVRSGVDMRGWLECMERDDLPASINVLVRTPMRFAGRGSHIVTTPYALLRTRVYALEFAADERALSDERWWALFDALDAYLPSERMPAREVLAMCARMELSGRLRPGDALRSGAWLYRLGGTRAGLYARRVLSVERKYASLEEAVALEILSSLECADTAGADPVCADTEGLPFAPECMGRREWMDVRAERAEMLRALGIDRLPARYWQLLEAAPPRRRLMFSSMCTQDEREYCRSYLLGTYHMSISQLEARPDVRRLFPELIEEQKAQRIARRAARQ